MAVFKCKMCGGDLEIQEGMSICECMYCGTKQTLPKLDSERKANLYDRANHFRRNNEFDKAMSMYEQILEEDKEDAEAYWSLVLCAYGIEYVEDPTSRKRIPTVNRTQFTSIFADENYKAALQYADSNQRQIYEEEAKQIDEIQKGILDISNREEPYDVFICYKETDDYGRRTPDSVLANDLYHQLSQEGFKVFFARITLEDKLGSAYEPYIFAALNSAKVMVVLGTKPEYFNAVWVKNEWSRYLSLIKNGAPKVLIPAYKDMDPYDMPQEFSHLQSQDMSKLGFMQDLLRGIKKLTDTGKLAQTDNSAGAGTMETGAAPLLKRAFLFLEDGDFERADEFCEKVLNLDPENAEAYLGKLMVEKQIGKRESLAQFTDRLDQSDYYHKIMRFGNDAIKDEVSGYNLQIIKRQEEEAERERIRRKEELEKQNAETYQNAIEMLRTASSSWQVKQALQQLRKLPDYKDTETHIREAEAKFTQLKKTERAKKVKRTVIIAAVVAVVIVIGIVGNTIRMRPLYAETEELLRSGEYDAAYDLLAGATSENKAGDAIAKQMLDMGLECVENEEYETAKEIFNRMSSRMKTSKTIDEIKDSLYEAVEQYVQNEEGEKAETILSVLTNSRFIENEEEVYNLTMLYVEMKDYIRAYELLERYARYGDFEPVKTDLSYKAKQQEIRQAEVGDIVTFGVYEQDADTTNGMEPIEWIVLNKSGDGKCLLFSKDVLDIVEEQYGGIADYQLLIWRFADLRTWMNSTFYETAFNSVEKGYILNTTLKSDDLHRFGDVLVFGEYDSKFDTEDKVFALSISDIENEMHPNDTFSERYDFNDEFPAGKTTSSRYCKVRREEVTGEDTFTSSSYALRTQSHYSKPIVVVSRNGSSKYDAGGNRSNDWPIYVGARPAIWFDTGTAE